MCSFIPLTIGGVREDYKTPKEERNQADNLLYLCLEHHTLVDDKKNEHKYPASVLRQWKNDQNEFIDSLNNNQSSIAKSLICKIKTSNSRGKSFAILLKKMFLECQNFVYRNHLKEASVLFDQIRIFSLELTDSSIIINHRLLQSILYRKEEKITNAKKVLNELINEFPNAIDPMFEYVDLCNNFPENDDKNNEIEKKLHKIAPEDPRSILIVLEKKYINKEKIDDNFLIPHDSNPFIRSRFFSIYALLLHNNQKHNKNEILINEWENEQPLSPKPHLIRALCQTSTLLNSDSINRQTLLHGLSIIENEKKKMESKDPLSIREEINLFLQEFILYRYLLDYSFDIPNLYDLYNKILDLIEKCYFNPYINEILEQILPLWKISAEYWMRMVKNISNSSFRPSSKLIDLIFLQALQHNSLKKELHGFLKKISCNELVLLLDSVNNKDIGNISKILNTKSDSDFTLSFLTFLENKDLTINLKGFLNINPENDFQESFIYAEALIQKNRKKEALELINEFPLERINFLALMKIEKLSFEYNYYDLFIRVAIKY